LIVDNCLTNPLRVRKQALKAEYIDWLGYDGEVYKRICLTDVPGFREAIEAQVGEIDLLGMGYRLNYGGEMPNAAIHSDLGWGTHAAVLYLSHGEGGTAFWKHKASGATRIESGDVELFDAVKHDWNDESKWEQVGIAPIKFNRCAIYESAEFHSRYPFAAFGESLETGRLVAVAFFNLVKND
jgi:hypothetical protein